MICVYVAIGQKASTVAQIVKKLEQEGALEYTIVVSATALDPAPLQFLGLFKAYCGVFRDKGGHVCIVYDDLTKQAAAYRELSLLLVVLQAARLFPAMFYVHSRLLEAVCKLNDELGGFDYSFSDYRNSSGRYFCVYPHKRDLNYRRSNLF